MAELFPLGATLAGIAADASKPDFELRFNQLQNTIIRRVNDEIKRINETGGVNRQRVEELSREGLKLADALPVFTAFRQGNSNNLGQIQQLIEDAAVLAAALGPDDDVIQAEVDAFNAQRDAIVADLNNLFIFIHPDIVDGQVIQNLKKEIDTLNALDPVVGSKSGEPNNVTATTTVTDFQNTLNVALSVTQNTIFLTLDLEQNIQKKQAEILAEFTELTTVEAARQAQEIENIKADFANLLTAISLSFEANASFASELNKFLTPFKPAPGSVLNLFT